MNNRGFILRGKEDRTFGVNILRLILRFAGYSDVWLLSAAGYRQVERLRGCLVDDKIDAVHSNDLMGALVATEVISLSIAETCSQGAVVSLLNNTAHLRGVGESD